MQFFCKKTQKNAKKFAQFKNLLYFCTRFWKKLTAVSYQPSAISRQPSAISHQKKAEN